MYSVWCKVKKTNIILQIIKCNGKSTVPPTVIKYKERHPSDLRSKLSIHKHISLLFARYGFANTTPLTLANLLFVVYSPEFSSGPHGVQ